MFGLAVDLSGEAEQRRAGRLPTSTEPVPLTIASGDVGDHRNIIATRVWVCQDSAESGPEARSLRDGRNVMDC